jgi:predicted  nucleic acid-binding Zn-ribbon protein
MNTVAVVGVVISGLGFIAGVIYFVLNRRYSTAKKAREELEDIKDEQASIKERMAAMEQRQDDLTTAMGTCQENSEKRMRLLMDSQREFLGQFQQFTKLSLEDLKDMVKVLDKKIDTVSKDLRGVK